MLLEHVFRLSNGLVGVRTSFIVDYGERPNFQYQSHSKLDPVDLVLLDSLVTCGYLDSLLTVAMTTTIPSLPVHRNRAN